MKEILIMTGSMNVGGIENALVEMLKIIPYDKYKVTLLLECKEGVYLSEVPQTVEIINDEQILKLLYSSRKEQLKEMLKTGKFKSFIKMVYHSAAFQINKYRCSFYNWQCSELMKQDKHYDVAIAYHNPFRFPGNYIMNNVNADKKILWNHTNLKYDTVKTNGFEKVYEKYDMICSVSDAAGESFREIFPNLKIKYHTYYNVIETEKIRKKASVPIGMGIRHGIRLVTVGRLSPEKGQDRIPNIARILKECGTEFTWHVVGDGNLLDAIKSKLDEYGLSEEVILCGNQDNPYPYMANSDIYVQTSWQEGFPMVIGEALACGKYCVVTDVGGTREYFKNSKGYIVENNTDEELAKAITEVIESGDYKQKMVWEVRDSKYYADKFIELIDYVSGTR